MNQMLSLQMDRVPRRLANHMAGLGLDWSADRLQELLARLQQLRLPSSSLPSVAAAAIRPVTLQSIESGLRQSNSRLQRDVLDLLKSLKTGSGRATKPGLVNLRVTLLQMRADSLFTTYDMLFDAIASRSDAQVGMEMAGCDILLAQASAVEVPGYQSPPVFSYPDSQTRGGAINRARTTLPGQVVLAASLVRISRESNPTRLSSAHHEIGHQLAADLNMLEPSAQLIGTTIKARGVSPRIAALWQSWTSELVADVFGICFSGGAPAVDGLQRVLSLPPPLLFRIREGDPHPPGAVRVPFALAFAREVAPHPLLKRLEQRFWQTYGDGLRTMAGQRTKAIAAVAPMVARALAREPFSGLGQRSVMDATRTIRKRIARAVRAAENGPLPNTEALARENPLVAYAMLGFARIDGRLSPRMHRQKASAWLRRIAEIEFQTSKSG